MCTLQKDRSISFHDTTMRATSRHAFSRRRQWRSSTAITSDLRAKATSAFPALATTAYWRRGSIALSVGWRRIRRQPECLGPAYVADCATPARAFENGVRTLCPTRASGRVLVQVEG